jgi:hypothetical protein|tara:strand:- start:70 stop:1341 length:1272 start_codon:yes stop_codon:yes gene_type:complete
MERTMTPAQNKINCPNCGDEIDVQDILYHQVDDQLKKKYQDEIAKEKESFDAKFSALEVQQKSFDAQKKKQQEEIEKQVADQVKASEILLKKKLKNEAEQEQVEALTCLKEELNEKSSKIKELNKTTIELERTKREKDELEQKIKAESEIELTNKLIVERQKIQKEESDKNEFKVKELAKQLEDQKKLTEEMKRKQEQGSMQIQGEVQELGIEEWLADSFPLDAIEEIKKGERGADCLQIVHTRTRQNCGSIYYESKRTKSFQSTWIEKFKADIREKNADIGVLVTEVMPTNMDRMGLKEGVWVCSYEEFKGLSSVLREFIIKLSTALVTQENKGDKMGMLYDFLTSNEFKLQIESIVEGFSQMKADLETEQRAMRKIWKQREKQIEKVVINTIDMYGSIKGIAGNAVQSIPALELDSDESED